MTMGPGGRRLLLFCWEAGAAAAIVPVARAALLNGYKVFDLSLEPAASIIAGRVPGVARFRSEMAPGEVFATLLVGIGHSRRQDGINFWRKLHSRGPSVAVLDHWKGLGRYVFPEREGFESIPLPDRICVPDIATLEALCSLGLLRTHLAVTGHPALHAAAMRSSGPPQKELRAALGLPTDRPIYLFASETLHDHGLYEPCGAGCGLLELRLSRGRNVLDVVASEARRDGAALTLRSHPAQDSPRPQNIHSIPWELVDDESMLDAIDRVYGLSSMLLPLAVARGVDVVNLAPMLDGWAPEQSFLDAPVWAQIAAAGYFGRFGSEAAVRPDFGVGAQAVLAVIHDVCESRKVPL